MQPWLKPAQSWPLVKHQTMPGCPLQTCKWSFEIKVTIIPFVVGILEFSAIQFSILAFTCFYPILLRLTSPECTFRPEG